MDPQAAWDQLLAAYAAEDWDTVEELASALIAWLDRGGFPPAILKLAGLDAEWNCVLARAGCSHALAMLNATWSVCP